jgi:hypothetical protein
VSDAVVDLGSERGQYEYVTNIGSPAEKRGIVTMTRTLTEPKHGSCHMGRLVVTDGVVGG